MAARAKSTRGGRSAMAKEYGVPEADLEVYSDNLPVRFDNRALPDTVLRVGADPIRKPRPDDRLVGAVHCSEEQGLDGGPVIEGIAAGLCFDPVTGRRAMELRHASASKGLLFVLETCLEVSPASEAGRRTAETFVRTSRQSRDTQASGL